MTGSESLQADQAKSQRIGPSAQAQSGSNDFCSCHAQQRYREIAQRSHHLSSGTTTDAASVLIEGDVANPMEAILDRPMHTAESENALRAGTFGRHAGDSVDGFGAEFLRDHFGGVALNGKDLSGMWKVNVALQFATGPDLPHFDAAVAFICRDVLRGKKTPVLIRRYLGEAWADCL